MIICLDKRQTDGPLGIHVLPYCDDDDQCEGLIIKEIVDGGRIDRDGRFSVGDRIIEVNDQTLLNVNFETAQLLINDALKENQLKLNIVKNSRKKQMNYTLSNDNQLNSQQSIKQQSNIPNNHYDLNERLIDKNDLNLIKNTKDKVNEDKFNKLNQPNDSSSFFNEATPDDYTNDNAFKRNGTLNASNTRKLGKKYHIRLVKDLNGLGFSITTRDNQVGHCPPVYIKTILPVGAARKDGNLKSGDRLIEVNGIEMTGKSHEEVLNILKNIEIGHTVDLIVSRQGNSEFDRTSSNHSSFNKHQQIDQEATIGSATKLPRQLPTDKLDANQLDLSKTREVLSFNIPLNDTGSAGLGVSVKGKTTTSSTTKKTTDLGIFVKSVFHGGAAYKDGRLQANDQLISINGISLLNSNNEDAMETLRRVLLNNEGVKISSNSINLVVARLTDPLENPNNSLLSNNYSKDELYDTFGTRPTTATTDSYHQRNMSTISTDSIKLNFYEQNYQPSEESNSTNLNNDKIIKRTKVNGDLNDLYLNRKSAMLNDLISKESLLSNTESNDQFTISTPVRTSIKSDFTDSDNLNSLNFNKFNSSNRQDVLIENDNQENNNPNIYKDYFINNNGNKSTNEQLDSSLNKSKDSQMMNLSNVTNQLSLNDDEEFNFNFQRDGFGRQSMSEKRYAQMDACKNTDTFKRAKQRKMQQQSDNQQQQPNQEPQISSSIQNHQDHTFVKTLNAFESSSIERQSKRSLSKFQAGCCCFNDQQTYSTSSQHSSCPYHSSSQQTSPKTEQTTASNQNDYLFNLTSLKTNNMNGSIPIDQTLLYDNQQQFNLNQQLPLSPLFNNLDNQQVNQMNNKLNQQPNYLNNHAPMNAYLPSTNNFYPNGLSNGLSNGLTNGINNNNLNSLKKNNNMYQNQIGQWLGMKKSSSLESLQTLMHEAKKESINYNTNLPYNTLRRPSNKVQRNRNTNESFRTAIDKSYEEYMDNLTMETVNEEFSESGRYSITPSSLITNQPRLTKSLTTNESLNNQTTNYQSKPSTTSLGTQLSNGANEISDEEVGLIRRKSTGTSTKKKSGILRTLFRFGSKKFKQDKQQQLKANSVPQNIKKELEEEVVKIRARKAALHEQEVIREYYDRIMDQQKFYQIVNQQQQQRQPRLNSPKDNINNINNVNNVNNTISNSIVSNTLPTQSMQQQQFKKQQQQNLRNLYVMNDQQVALQQPAYSNHLPQSNQLIMNNSFDTPKYLQTGYALQNRSNGLETSTTIENQRPKSFYMSNTGAGAFENNTMLTNQNGYYYNDLNRKPFATNGLANRQHSNYSKDNQIQPFETTAHNYDLARPGSRKGLDGRVKIDEDLNNYVIVVKQQNSMNRSEMKKSYG